MLQLLRHGLVGSNRSVRAMPDSAIWIGVWICDRSERAVCSAPKLVGCIAIDGGPQQRVTKGHVFSNRDEAVGLGRCCRVGSDPELPAGSP